MEVADFHRLGAGDEGFAEDPRAPGGRQAAGVAVDLDDVQVRHADGVWRFTPTTPGATGATPHIAS